MGPVSRLELGRGMPRTQERWWAGVSWLMPLVILMYAVLGVLWSFTIPLGEGPDESAHFAYVRWLGTEGRLPVQADDASTSDVPGEGHQPPLAYALMVPAIAWLPDDATIVLPGNPEFRWNGGNQLNAYLHGVTEDPRSGGVVLAWHLARLWSVVLGGFSVALCAATVRRIWPNNTWLPVGAAAIVAFNPQWVFQHALVSNDPLTIALGCLLLYQTVAWVRRNDDNPQTVRSAVGMGLTLGLLLATKQSGFALAPLPFVACMLGSRAWSERIRHAAIVAGVCGVVSGWWYVRNTALYGDPLGLQVFQQTFATGDFSYRSWQSWRNGGWNLLRSSWGSFGWLTLPLPNGAFAIMQVILLVACAGLVASLGSTTWHGRGKGVLLLVLALALVAAWTVAFAFTAGAVAWQGRFLFPAAPAIGMLLAIGLGHAMPRRAGLLLLPSVCVALALVLPFSLIRPAYATPALQATEIPHGSMYARFDWGWKRAFELHDIAYARTAASGDTLRIGLTWHLAEQVDRSWFVFIHIVDAEENVVAKRDAEPLDETHPTNTWVTGDWYRDTHLVALPDVPPGTYHVRIGMWNPQDGERLGVYDERGRLQGDLIEAGELVITAAQPATP
ncbi:MAG: hypothetical protein AVDCRST_MAG93-4653 [uncultured Chloroflexia bacterium]|uniref:Glycosyltransferase RgtA/B/C/D-like domain-containing protein n=1 Tax=uncultured Chloroflexia bacterium TaxID=1672391 RepID=A0A6J4KBV8_9CHLR|nr:MAG: hypothetical protein AVDCRST_MAG93-4653 [uncultured Chloroflexia bacterium]